MTIKDLIKELTDYASYCKKGMYTEVKGYVGMSRQVAEARLEQLTMRDEYVYDDYLNIRHLDTDNITGNEGFVCITFEDIKE